MIGDRIKAWPDQTAPKLGVPGQPKRGTCSFLIVKHHNSLVILKCDGVMGLQPESFFICTLEESLWWDSKGTVRAVGPLTLCLLVLELG